MVAQNSIDGTGGWGIRNTQAAQTVLEQSQGAYAFPSTAPKPSPKFLVSQPSIPNDISKAVADLKHGSPDQSGLYTAYAGKPPKVRTTPFNNKIKGNPETQYHQPFPNMKGDDLLPADDGTPLRPSSLIKKISEAAKSLSESPDNATRRAELIRMYHDLMRIFYISERRPLNSDEISRVEEYARVIDRLLLQGPVQHPQRDIINQDLLDQRDIINQDMLDQIGEPEPVEPVEPVEPEPVAFGQFENQLHFIYDNDASDDASDYAIDDASDESIELVQLGIDDYKHNPPILGSLGSSGYLGSLGSSSSSGYLESLGSLGSISLESLGSLGSSSSISLESLGSDYSSKNVMSADTYAPERKIDTPSELEFTPTPTPALTPTPQSVERDEDLMFNALNLIKNRFNLKGARKNEMLSYIRNSPDPEVAKSFAELQEFAKTQKPGNRSKDQEQYMRNYLKANFSQVEKRGRPRSKR